MLVIVTIIGGQGKCAAGLASFGVWLLLRRVSRRHFASLAAWKHCAQDMCDASNHPGTVDHNVSVFTRYFHMIMPSAPGQFP